MTEIRHPREGADYVPPSGCTLRDVERFRPLVAAGRQLGARPGSRVAGLGAALKAASKASLPRAERHQASPFIRLIRQLRAFGPLAAELKPKRALEIAGLAEAVAQGLGDPFDADVAGRALNPVRSRADLDN